VVAEAAGKSPLEVKHVDLRRERNRVIINKHLMRMTNVQPFSTVHLKLNYRLKSSILFSF
jgi:hypothetical protein